MPEVDPMVASNEAQLAQDVANRSKLIAQVSEGRKTVRIDGQAIQVNPEKIDYRDPNNSPRANTQSAVLAGVRDEPKAQGSALAGEETPAVLLSPKAPESTPRPVTPAAPMGTPAPQRTAPPPAPAPAPAPQPQLVELELEGTTVQLPREVAAKLVQQGQQVERAQELMQRAQAVRDDTAFDVLASGAYRNATPEQRRQFLEWMRNAGAPVPNAPAAGLDEAGEAAPQPQSAPAVEPPGWREAQRNLQMLTQDLQERRNSETRARTEQWIGAQVAQVPVFAENQALRQLAERDMKAALQANPRVDPAVLLAKVTTHYTQVATAARGAAGTPPPVVGQGRGATAPLAPAAAPQADRPAFTGKDLKQGAVRKAVARYLAGI